MNFMQTKKRIPFLIMSLSALFLTQCSPPPQNVMFEKPAVPAPVTLMAGDVIDVKFFYTPEINESQAIRPDGKISLQLLGDVTVIGKTPDELRHELISTYSSHLKNPDIAVIIRSMNERRVYVGGEVMRPGVFPLAGSLTALEAIMDAGGFNNATAKPGSVVIIRRQGDNWRGKVIDLSSPLKGNNVILGELQPRDIVFVPRTCVSKVDQWVDQHINKVIPEIFNSVAGGAVNAEVYHQINK